MRLPPFSLTDATDEALMDLLARERHEGAFDELYRRYSQRMLHFFYRMLDRDEAVAQDFLQELFLKLVEKPHRYDPRRRFSTWFFTVASNMVKNEYRRRGVRRGEVPLTDALPVGIPPQEDGPDRATLTAQLEQALDQLNPAQREAILLRYREEHSIKEISELMTCSEGTVKSRLFYGLRQLARGLVAFQTVLQDL
ncbi:MAG: sigma-70 family RNA polymerase sigma factor [Bacteroidetes bacterium]|nr:MAG: sigma-70 family RNA polymerase sigma factor [Bacteroidota bacterium]